MTRGTADHAANPERIGPYRILDLLGEGGMGTVYLAEQKEPVWRRVALKVIKLGMDSKQILHRFEAERQALALMQHPNIAQVFDCGTTERGQSYFAMEHVKGLPITHYCDENRLGVEERLRLFQEVCAGVQHAHQKGVIHRDLTANNVLVTIQDGKPVTKIIDFGLARATDHRLVDATLFTQHGMIIGTPEYMSPEQAGLDNLDIDTRTDIYTLGVLLYELLVGEVPFSREELRGATIVELQRKIREDEPPKPSTRLTTSARSGQTAAQRRRTDVRALCRRLQSDLDWIVMKALEKDRTRRYPTANAFAQDIQRHLDDVPVEAGPPSAVYRLRKFVRRYRGRVIAAGLIVAALLAGVTGTTYFMVEARANEKAANARAEEARRERERADREAREAIAARKEAYERAIAESAAREQAVENLDKFNLLANVVNLREARDQESALYPAWPENVEAMQRWITERAEPLVATLPALRETLDELRTRAVKDRPWTLPRKEDQFLHDTLERLVEDLDEFASQKGLLADVRERQRWARTIRGRSIDAHRARWEQARAAIAAADGRRASAAYAEQPIELAPQLGLVPIGANPATGLWEFYHLRSGSDDHPIPEHDADGNVAVGPETGIVFVLVPGATSTLGGQHRDPEGPNFDPLAQPNEDVRRVTVGPFFMARHELTQAQWERLSGGETPSDYGVGRVFENIEATVTAAHPVEQVSWVMAQELLRRHGLSLPTEAQWEHACRAGTDSPWSTGATVQTVAGYANIADRTASRSVPSWNAEDTIDDGHVIHAPVGSFRPNPFGLFDVHGNVWEWCRDAFGDSGAHVLRGGSFVNPARYARSASRNTAPAHTRVNNLGVRPGREIRDP